MMLHGIPQVYITDVADTGHFKTVVASRSRQGFESMQCALTWSRQHVGQQVGVIDREALASPQQRVILQACKQYLAD